MEEFQEQLASVGLASLAQLIKRSTPLLLHGFPYMQTYLWESISVRFLTRFSSPSRVGSNSAPSLVCSIENVNSPVVISSGQLYIVFALWQYISLSVTSREAYRLCTFSPGCMRNKWDNNYNYYTVLYSSTCTVLDFSKQRRYFWNVHSVFCPNNFRTASLAQLPHTARALVVLIYVKSCWLNGTRMTNKNGCSHLTRQWHPVPVGPDSASPQTPLVSCSSPLPRHTTAGGGGVRKQGEWELLAISQIKMIHYVHAYTHAHSVID